MAKDDLHNLKMTHSPFHDKDGQKVSGKYYGHQVAKYETNSAGGHDIDYADINDKDSHNIRSRLNGSLEYDYQGGGGGKDKEFSTRMHSRHYREFTGVGRSKHAGGNAEDFTGKCDNGNCGGDQYRQGKKDRAAGYTKNYGSVSENQVRLKSKSNDASASGDTMTITNTPGSRSDHNNNSGIKTHGDIKYDVFKKDAGAHYQENGDLAASKKMQIQSLKDNMMVTAQEKDVQIEAKKGNVTIKAQSKITLTVGGSSITIESNQVTIKSQKIILDGETHCGGQGGQLAGTCGGGCASKTFVNFKDTLYINKVKEQYEGSNFKCREIDMDLYIFGTIESIRGSI